MEEKFLSVLKTATDNLEAEFFEYDGARVHHLDDYIQSRYRIQEVDNIYVIDYSKRHIIQRSICHEFYYQIRRQDIYNDSYKMKLGVCDDVIANFGYDEFNAMMLDYVFVPDFTFYHCNSDDSKDFAVIIRSLPFLVSEELTYEIQRFIKFIMGNDYKIGVFIILNNTLDVTKNTLRQYFDEFMKQTDPDDWRRIHFIIREVPDSEAVEIKLSHIFGSQFLSHIYDIE